MNFFEELSRIDGDFTVKFSVNKRKHDLSVMITNEIEGAELPPIAFSGMPKMIDKVFMNAIASWLADAQKVLVKTEEVNEGTENAEKEKSPETDVVPEQTKEGIGYEAPKEDEPPKVVTSPKFKKDVNDNEGEKTSEQKEQKEPVNINESSNENTGLIEDDFDDEW